MGYELRAGHDYGSISSNTLPSTLAGDCGNFARIFKKTLPMSADERLHRVLRLVQLLQSGRNHNANQLAEMCGVSRRTIFRYINTLQEGGIHIQYDEQQQGYSLPSNTYLPPTEFTLDEALALLTLCYELADGDGGVPFQNGARNAALKLASNLPQHLRDQLNGVSQTLAVRLDSHNPLSADRSYYDLFVKAVSRRRCVRIQYQSLTEWENISTVVHPYRLLFIRRSWYVIGRSTMHREVRTFNLGRVLAADLLDRTYTIPPRFSLERYLGNAWHLIREPGKSQQVVVRFQKMVAQNVAEVRWHKTQKVTWNDDETMDFSVTVDGLNEISWWILGYGDQAEVLRPGKLRMLIAERLRGMTETYAKELATVNKPKS